MCGGQEVAGDENVKPLRDDWISPDGWWLDYADAGVVPLTTMVFNKAGTESFLQIMSAAGSDEPPTNPRYGNYKTEFNDIVALPMHIAWALLDITGMWDS